MDYRAAYDRLIRKAKGTYPFGSTERHHILPKSMGGTDDWDNLVRLSLRAHEHAHLLLYSMGEWRQIFAVVAIRKRRGLKLTKFMRKALARAEHKAQVEKFRKELAEKCQRS